jgi:hypothetical protein
MRRVVDERGAIGGIEGLAFGILIFVFGMFMVLNAWAVVDGTMTATAAAREATRAYVEAGSQQQAVVAAQAATTGANHRITAVNLTPPGNFERCQPVTATVTLEVPRMSLPLIGGAGGVVDVHGSHTEVIDPYRSGLAASGGC